MLSTQTSLLLIGYNYPPGGGIGSVRIAKFAKYLPNNWDIHVLTSGANIGPDTDAGIDDGDNVTVHRVREILSGASKDFDKLRWAPPVVLSVRNLHREHEFDAIWHTSGPFLPLTAVPVLKRLLDVRYIVDLRDSWTLHPYKSERTLFGHLYDKVSTVVEPRVLHAADIVTTATEGITNAYREKYPSIRDKFTTIENGYDPSDFPQLDVENAERFTIVYVGKFASFRDPTPFLEALANVQEKVDIDFVHVGTPEESVQSAVSRLNIEDCFECTGFVDRAEVTRQIRRADLGLAISGGSPQEMTTKIFDYIACDTPILACGPPRGAMANVAGRFEHGYVTPNQSTNISKQLIRITEICPVDLGNGPYDRYTRKHSANMLEELINNIS